MFLAYASAMGVGDVRFGLLGPVQAWNDGSPLEIRGTVRRTLLAALLINPGTVVSVGQLIEIIWGSKAVTPPVAALYNQITRLRRSLGTGGERLEAALKEIAANVKKAASVDIGFPSGGQYSDGTSVALVAAINEYGRPSIGQPPRPFFRNMIAEKSPEWPNTVKALLIANNYDAEKTLEQVGVVIKNQLQASIQEFTSPPLKPSTIAAKGFDKPLIDSGEMRNSVDFVVKS